MPMSVVIVDSQELVRRGIADVLSEAPGIEVEAVASTSRDGLTAVVSVRPDVAIIDLSLGEAVGIDLCELVHERAPDTRIVARCAGDDDHRLQGALVAGAAGHVSDRSSAVDIVARVRSVHEGQVSLGPAVAADLFDRLRAEHPDPARPTTALTHREREILAHVAEGLTNRQIGEALHLSPKTVKNYVSGILKKLGLQSRVEAAVHMARHSVPA